MRAFIVIILDYLTKTDENIYKIEFIHFRIRDMKNNKIIFEVKRDPGKSKNSFDFDIFLKFYIEFF